MFNAARAVGPELSDPFPPDPFPPFIAGNDPTGTTTGPIEKLRLQFSNDINAATFTQSDIVSFTGPDGPIQVLAILPVPGDSKSFDLTFSQHPSRHATIVSGFCFSVAHHSPRLPHQTSPGHAIPP